MNQGPNNSQPFDERDDLPMQSTRPWSKRSLLIIHTVEFGPSFVELSPIATDVVKYRRLPGYQTLVPGLKDRFLYSNGTDLISLPIPTAPRYSHCLMLFRILDNPYQTPFP